MTFKKSKRQSLWRDETGAIISTELVLIAVVAVLGLMAGFVSMRDAVVSELSDVSGATDDLNQSYSYNGISILRNEDGTFTVDTSHPPINEGEELDIPDPVDPIVHTVSDDATLSFGNVDNGVGGSVSGTLEAADGTSTTFETTTDTGNIAGIINGDIAFVEDANNEGTFTTTFAAPVTDLELFVAGLYGGPNENLLGNFTVTLSDGTVMNNAAFDILQDTISPNTAVGAFTTFSTDRELLRTTTVGGFDYVRDQTPNGSNRQAAGRIVFRDIPAPGPDCIGISSVSFERSGGQSGFLSYFNFSGKIVEIEP